MTSPYMTHGTAMVALRVFLRLFLYFGLAWTALFWKRWRKSSSEQRAQSWPSVGCVVIGGRVNPVPKTRKYLATLTYSYFVDEYRSGTYVHEFGREADADEFVGQMKDKRLQLRYRQEKPNVSVLEQSAVEQVVALAPRFE